MALIDNIQDPGVDAIFGIQTEYRKDERDFKVNLTVGVYVEEDGGKPPIMKAIKNAEEKLLKDEITKSYLGIAGDQEYLSLTAKLVFGDIDQSEIAMIQTIGGTSALRLGFEFLRKNGLDQVSVSDPTWANHLQILNNLDYKIHTYDHREAAINFAVYLDHLNSLDNGSLILLQARNHNPTGIDFTKSQWKEISEICKKKNLFPFFDSAYQGFAQSLKDDAWAIRYFIEEGHDIIVAHSFSKSMALYNERVGALFVLFNDKNKTEIIKRNLMKIVRVNYSNPPFHGAAAVKNILKDDQLYAIWQAELKEHRERINHIRKKFANALIPFIEEKKVAEIANGNGFFCQVPFTKEEIDRLKHEFGIYMTYSGRISLPGLNENCFGYVIDSFKKIKE